MILKVIAKVAIKGRFQRFKHSTHVSDLGKETLKNVHQRNYRIFKEGKRGGGWTHLRLTFSFLAMKNH